MVEEQFMEELADLKSMLNEQFTFIEGQFHAIDERFEAVDRKIDKKFQKIDTQLFHHCREFAELHEADRRIEKKLDGLITTIDGFLHLHRTLDVESAANRARTERLEERVTRLEKTK